MFGHAAPTLVNDRSGLSPFLDDLHRSDRVAVDMEFSNDTTRILLMQFATAERVYLLDPPAIRDLTPVFAWLSDPSEAKIFHSGQDDTRLVARQYDVAVRGVLDTQVYASFCGYRYPSGLAALLETVLGVSMSKAQQRSDWSARPLSKAQVAYAAEDVVHLHALIAHFEERLSGTPKSEWAAEESRRVVEARTAFSHPEAGDWRFLDDYRDTPEMTLIALRLLDWSRTLHLPRGGGKKRKARPRDLERILRRIGAGNGLAAGTWDAPNWLTGAHVAAIQAMRETPATPEESARLKRLPPPGPPAAERNARVSQVQAFVEERCTEHTIDAALVATKGAVEDLVRFGDAAESILTRGWRSDLLGSVRYPPGP